MKNFRKGLKYQRERCLRELAAAADTGDAATAADRNDRLLWIRQKQAFVDTGNEMAKDTPVRKNGRLMEYGSLACAARRQLTDKEIRWNAWMIEAEGATPATPAAATPAAATAPPPAPTPPGRKSSNDSPSEGAKAATKVKSASPCEDGLTSKAPPPAKRMPSRGPPPGLAKSSQDGPPPPIAATAGPPPVRRRPFQRRSPPPAPGLVRAEMERDTSEAERDRQAHRQVRGPSAQLSGRRPPRFQTKRR